MQETKQKKNKFRSIDALIIGGVFFVAFFLRLVYLYQYKNNPFFLSPVIDALSHYLYAMRMSQGDWLLKGEVVGRAPLYVYFLAFLFKMFGSGYFAARIVQMLLGALNCVLVYFLGKKVFNRYVGAIAAFICSAYGVLIYFDAEFLYVGLGIFVNLLLLLFVLHTVESPRFWKWICCGMLFGMGLQTNALIILFLPFLLIWIYLYSNKKAVTAVLLVVLGAVVFVLPFALRNYLEGGDVMLISSAAGINLYIGNNPGADGKSAFVPSRDFSYAEGWQDNVLTSSIKAAERELGHELTPSEVSRFWTLKAASFILKDPGSFCLLLIRKFFYFFNGYEIAENQSIYFFRVWSSLLKITVFENSVIAFPFGLICPFALLGIFVSFRKGKGAHLLRFFVLANFILLMIFFVCSRYRTNVVPYFIIFSAYGVFWIFNNLKKKNFKPVVCSVFPLLLLSSFSNSTLLGVREEDDSRWFFNLGAAFSYKGQKERALKSFQSAKDINPKNPDVLYNLGVLYLKKGDEQQAAEEFEQVVEIDPDDSAAHTNLGIVYFRQGKFEKAIKSYEAALGIDEEDIGVMVNLGAAYTKTGDFSNASVVFKKAKSLEPGFAPLHQHLAILYEKTNDYKNAEMEYLLAIQQKPDYFEAYNNLALLYEKMEQPEEAKVYRLKALEILPDMTH
ncbi:MAG: tetratricopeptide repeat protein [PVC group bacterium]|nr:tetratricopeptide repeat protein [PVC group bacterium]